MILNLIFRCVMVQMRIVGVVGTMGIEKDENNDEAKDYENETKDYENETKNEYYTTRENSSFYDIYINIQYIKKQNDIVYNKFLEKSTHALQIEDKKYISSPIPIPTIPIPIKK